MTTSADHYKSTHRVVGIDPSLMRVGDQEFWIKTHVPKAAQTQCTKCGKWISKFWKEGSSETNIMTTCGSCDARRR